MEKLVRVGVMPGRINEFAVTPGTSITEVLNMAELNSAGYDIKVDGAVITDPEDCVVDENTNLILLVKQVKGN